MSITMQNPPDFITAIAQAKHHDPFSVLGRHGHPDTTVIRIFIPEAKKISIEGLDEVLSCISEAGIFEWQGNSTKLPPHYKIRWYDKHDNLHTEYDPYDFLPQLPDYDMHLFGEGRHWHIYKFLGANPWVIDGVKGVLFATWAPNASHVSVIGDFNQWDGRRHAMRNRNHSGLWETFIPEIGAGELYKFEIRSHHTGQLMVKCDPYAKFAELRPNTANIVCDNKAYPWKDQKWIGQRDAKAWLHKPLSIYEVHLASWQRRANNDFLSYRELAITLVDYVKKLGFTHIELLPITEHPLDASWGYQTLGYFAPTSRHGSPDDFRYFIDYCHQHDIGVLLDWVPAHFPTDSHGLARYDGTALYEHEDPRLGEHRDWGTYIFNYGRNEVKNFLLASALYWLEEFHIDGLRVDAVASMLYLDYSREADDWIPNKYGGRENLEAIDFLRELNTMTQTQQPGTLLMAEESTAWPQVSRPTWLGGLGFNMKWNMGWMHDTLEYMKKDPIHRHYHHDQLTFGLLYSFTENFILPFSHDEVVHGKQSLRYRMPGDEWQQFANLRLLYTYMFTYPGKKLLFMGCEFGQGSEWNHETSLDWYTLEYPLHQGVQKIVSDLNHLYQKEQSLHRYEFEEQGFEWIDCHDASQSVLSYLRKAENQIMIVVLNFTPMVRENYRVGVPKAGDYQEIFNSDSEYYGGSNKGNPPIISSEDKPWMDRAYSLSITLPPLAGILLFYKDPANEITAEIEHTETQTDKKQTLATTRI